MSVERYTFSISAECKKKGGPPSVINNADSTENVERRLIEGNDFGQKLLRIVPTLSPLGSDREPCEMKRRNSEDKNTTYLMTSLE